MSPLKSQPDIKQYLDEVQAHLATKQAREHTYRPAQVAFFDSFENIKTANDQARTIHGSTDYVFRNRNNEDIVLGYGEAKDIDVDLDKTEKTEQLERYGGYNNLILTNYIEFRFFKNGKRYAQVEIAKLNSDHTITPVPENFTQLIEEVQAFFEQPPEVIKSAKRLSEIMGAKARRIRMNVEILLKANAENSNAAPEVSKVFALMRELLVHDLDEAKFADMYAQTLVYGLFVAHYSDKSPDTFSRVEARDLVPASNPFLREFFDHIAGPRFEKGLAIIVDELCQVFSVSDVTSIIDKYLKLEGEDQNDAKDPIIHFYEDFLAEYDPAEKKKMGAYYTPTPVVRYMVRAVDKVLKEQFGLEKGLADSSKETFDVVVQGKKGKQTAHKVQVLDPATGTGTFLNEIIKFVHEGFKGQEGLWPTYAREHLIPRLHGFELMMGAYTIAHLKLGLTLKNLGVDDLGERVGIYLTNSLEEGSPAQADLFSFGLAEAVTSEATQAAHIKSERPIMVVIGNPPYSGVSSNNTEYANSLVKKYKVEPGGLTRLNERNPKMLNDDYVKFIALAEDLIIKNGEGVLAFITNHGYLDNPTFRGMRWHLAKTFDSIDIIDLHGNAKKKETAPDGSKDENVFDIMQGVSIVVATKLSGSRRKVAKVLTADVYGKRKEKFDLLNAEEIDSIKLDLDEKQYFLTYKNVEGKGTYNRGFSLKDLFLVNSVGLYTSRDNMAIQFKNLEMKLIIDDFLNHESEFLRDKYHLGKDVRDWTVQGAIDDVRTERGSFTQITYRPFDERWTYYTGKSTGFQCMPRAEVMKNFLEHENLGLLITRKLDQARNWCDVFAVKKITTNHSLSIKEANTCCPLWLYDDQGNKSSNLKPAIVAEIKKTASIADEQGIFDYIYGVLHWPEYREKYKEFLKTDFPRVPYPKDEKEFERFRSVGEKLRELHLMTSPDASKLITTYPEAGSNIVEKISYNADKIFINPDQYFGQVPQEAWEFYIGGYQPAQKWLKDRKGRELSAEDIGHYQKIIKVLFETHRIMSEI
jgi:predicted helicase